MFKKFLALIAVFAMILLYSSEVFAAGVDDVVSNKWTKSTSQFIVIITRPDDNESTFRKSYIICGNTRKENIRVKLLILNKNTGTYELFNNSNGENSWDIGASGVFMKEIDLPYEGSNTIRIVAYDKYASKSLVAGKNLQISDFTITLLNNNIKNNIKNRFVRFTDMLYKMFE